MSVGGRKFMSVWTIKNSNANEKKITSPSTTQEKQNWNRCSGLTLPHFLSIHRLRSCIPPDITTRQNLSTPFTRPSTPSFQCLPLLLLLQAMLDARTNTKMLEAVSKTWKTFETHKLFSLAQSCLQDPTSYSRETILSKSDIISPLIVYCSQLPSPPIIVGFQWKCPGGLQASHFRPRWAPWWTHRTWLGQADSPNILLPPP